MRFLSGIVLFALIFVPAAPVRASCGAAGCAVDTGSWDERRAGEVTLGYEFEYADQDQHRIGTRDAAFREIRGHHDEEFTVNRTHRGSVSAAFTDRISADLSVPFISRSHAHIHRHQGADILESWDLDGIGDLRLLTHWMFWKPENRRNPALSALLGGEFPTGKHKEENEAGEIAELGIQPGSNSYDLILGLSSSQRFEVPMLRGGRAEMPFFAGVTGQFNGPGTDDYRLGDRLQVNAGVSYPLTRHWGLLGQLNFLLRDRDDKGKTGEEIQKTGGEFLYFSPGLEFRPSERWRFYGLVQVPVYQRVNLIQIVSDYNLLFGASFKFDAGKKKQVR